MKIARSFVKVSGLLLACGALIGTTYATSLVTPKTTICANTSIESRVQAKSLFIAPYYNNKPLGSAVGTPSENGTCVIVDRDWLMGGAQPGTSFVVTWKDKNNLTYLLESRDIAMFKDKEMKDIARIVLNYDINSTVVSSTTRLVGSVKSELYIFDAGGVKTVTQRGKYRSDLHDYDAFDVMRQIDATRYTKIVDFKGKDNVTREQAAKFFYAARLATHTDDELPTDAASKTAGCTFTDKASIDPSLVGAVINACYLGLMKGASGKFRPTDTLTVAEAVTVLIRMQYTGQNETYTPWYRAYFDKGYDVELFDGFAYNPHLSEGTLPISREMIGFLIRRILQIDNVPIKTYPTI